MQQAKNRYTVRELTKQYDNWSASADREPVDLVPSAWGAIIPQRLGEVLAVPDGEAHELPPIPQEYRARLLAQGWRVVVGENGRKLCTPGNVPRTHDF